MALAEWLTRSRLAAEVPYGARPMAGHLTGRVLPDTFA